MKHYWKLSIIGTNLAVATVILVLFLDHEISSFPELWRTLIYSLICANLIGTAGFVVIGGIAKHFLQRNIPAMPVVTVGLILFTVLGCLLAQTILMSLGLGRAGYFWSSYLASLRIAVPLAVMFGLGALIYGTLQGRVYEMEQKLRDKEIAEERNLKLLAEARLRALESRIHPHFLFNTLNSIMSLTVVNPVLAERVVGRLAGLLRASLNTMDRPLIALREEIALVEGYLEIEKVRFGDKLQSRVEVPASLENIPVPPMSIQSLVENAVKHGVTPLETTGEVLLHAFIENNSLHIEVSDNGPGFNLSAIRAGHGLDNLVGRLDALFDSRASLNVVQRDGRSVVRMTVPVA